MGGKTPKFEHVNGYKVVETDGPTFKIYDGADQIGEDFPYSGKGAAYSRSLPARDVPITRNPIPGF